MTIGYLVGSMLTLFFVGVLFGFLLRGVISSTMSFLKE